MVNVARGTTFMRKPKSLKVNLFIWDIVKSKTSSSSVEKKYICRERLGFWHSQGGGGFHRHKTHLGRCFPSLNLTSCPNLEKKKKNMADLSYLLQLRSTYFCLYCQILPPFSVLLYHFLLGPAVLKRSLCHRSRVKALRFKTHGA